MARAREDSSGFKQYVLAFYYLASKRLSVTAIVTGLVTIVVGGIGVTQIHDVLGPMIAIWGATLVLLGGIAYVALLGNRFVAKYAE